MDGTDRNVVDLVPQVQQNKESTTHDTELTDTVKEAWDLRCSSLGGDEKKKFESYACSGFAEYLETLKAACQRHRDESYVHSVVDWFGPLFKAVELFTPAASVAVQAYPNPGSLVLGGIVGVLQITSRLDYYQKMTLQMLAKMGRSARVLLEYERDTYKNEYMVQKALIQVYGDILVFCQKAFRFLTENGELRAKIKGLKLLMWRDFESQLGKEVKEFEEHLEDLEIKACLCDKRRLKELYDSQQAHNAEFGRAFAETRDYFQRHDDILESLWKRENELREQTERRKRKKEKARLLEYLSPLSFHVSYDRRCEEHLDGTGFWFLDSSTYKQWKSRKEPDLIWIKGKPGCGKSVLAAITITDLKVELEPGVALAYAFCRREDDSSQNPSSIFGALAKQISQQQLDVNSDLESRFVASQNGETLSQRDLRTIMKSALSHFSKTYIVIDALDECKNNHELAQDLLDLMKDDMVSRIKIIIFSRHDFLLEECFKPYQQLQPDLGANEEDLKAYIESRFPDDSQANVNREIRDECIAKADGMFLWVKLLAQNLQKPLNSKQKLRRIKDIPPGLGSIYDRILKDIYDQDEDIRSTAFLVLIWVTHARRPLNRSEMLEAVADYSEATKLEHVFKHENPENLVAICANLVFIDKDGCFRLCHESVRGHLDKTSTKMSLALVEYHQHKEVAHKRLAEICLTYLLLEDFDCGPAKSSGRLKSLLAKYPFLEYAAKSWGRHGSQGDAFVLRDLIEKFVLSISRRELSMQICLYDDSNLWKYVGSSNPLHILSIFGLIEIAKTLSDRVRLSQEADGSGATPLTYALSGNHHEMSLWCIEQIQSEHGLRLDATQKARAVVMSAILGWVDVLNILISEDENLANAKSDQSACTPLTGACLAGKIEAVATLIKHNANVDLSDGDGDTALIISIMNDNKDIVTLLLDDGADPNRRDASKATPLHYAAQSSDAAMAVALLKKRADPLATAPGSDDQTALHIAAEAQSVEVIRALHLVLTSLDMKGRRGPTALHVAAWHNSSKSAEVLLELGASKDEVDDYKRTALYIAAQEGAFDTVKVLVKAACDVNLANSEGETAIHVAAGSGKLSVLRCIMKSQPLESWKALVNKSGENGETPIHKAVDSGNAEVVKFLLNAGADGTAEGLLESSPLHYAAHYGHSAIACLLLNHTKEPNPRNKHGDTPLHFGARARRSNFIEKYFDHCSQSGLSVEIDAQNDSQKNPLTVALDEKCEEAAKILIEKGSASSPDLDGNYPIHQAAWHGFDSLVQALLSHDGVTNQGYFGRTPLFCAALRGRLKTLKLLFPHSHKCLNARDDEQTTPLMAALANRHLEVANYLLDLQAECNDVNEHGSCPLQIAAEIGDLPILQRLLKLGCKGDIVSRYGDTLFHKAVEGDSIEIIDALLATGFNSLAVPDGIGNSCSMIAARRGNLKMLQKLDEHGALSKSCNLLGRTAAYSAADGGHWEVLRFLKEHGEDLNTADLEGNTALMVAAQGYPESVKYLLQSQADAVNDFNSWDLESPILLAAQSRSTLTIQYLLAAGADPYHRDATGINSLDYASQHRPSLREMHKAGHFHLPGDIEARQQRSRITIRQCCKQILQLPQEPSVGELYHRLSRICTLAKALICVDDYSAAKTCSMELFWKPKFALLSPSFACFVCSSKSLARDKYVCKTCSSWTLLCHKCHKEYEKAGKGPPEASKAMTGLEKQVQPVRVAISDGLSVVEVYKALNYFVGAARWISSMRNEYEIWEQKYNSSGDYREQERPGQEFLTILKEVDEWASKLCVDNAAEDEKRIFELNDKYQAHRRKHKADREIMDLTCENHDFLVVAAEEQKELKSAGVYLDPDSGRLTATFLEEILTKYEHNSGTQDSGVGCNDKEFSLKEPQLDLVDDQEDEVEASSPRGLKRAFSTPLWKLTRPLNDRYPILASAPANNTSYPILSSKSRDSRQLQRAKTLPVFSDKATSHQARRFHVEIKDGGGLPNLQARIGSNDIGKAPPRSASRISQSTTKKTISVSFSTISDAVVGHPEVVSPPAEEEQVHLASSSDPPEMFTSVLNLSSEPEPISEPTTRGNGLALPERFDEIAPVAAVEQQGPEGNSDTESVAVERVVRIAYLMANDGGEADDDMMTWVYALNISNAIFPGFINNYLELKREEEEEKEEAGSGRAGNDEANDKERRDDDDDDNDENLE